MNLGPNFSGMSRQSLFAGQRNAPVPQNQLGQQQQQEQSVPPSLASRIDGATPSSIPRQAAVAMPPPPMPNQMQQPMPNLPQRQGTQPAMNPGSYGVAPQPPRPNGVPDSAQWDGSTWRDRQTFSTNDWDSNGRPVNFRLSDIRLKSNIQRVGTHPLGVGVYDYDIEGRRERGVMAQELLHVLPSAVSVGDDGFYRVNYEAL